MHTRQEIRERIWETLRRIASIAMARSYGILGAGYNNGVLGMNVKALVRAVS